jgi:GAF domain-containing protein
MSRRVAALLAITTGLLLPLGLAALWIPVRTRWPNTDLALLLVAVVAAVGAFGNRVAVLVSAVSAAFWFEFLDTAPFGHLAIAHRPDLETTVVLAVVSLIVGELSVRIVRHRAASASDLARRTSVSETASLLASGEELVPVIQAVAGYLRTVLTLDECAFGAGPGDPALAVVSRHGELQRAPGGLGVGPPTTAVLPVWGHNQVLGHFVLEFAPGRSPASADLATAVTLADQVGAAFMTQAPPPPDPAAGPPSGLHVVR